MGRASAAPFAFSPSPLCHPPPHSHETVRTRMREQPPIPGVRSRYHSMFPSLRLIAIEEGRHGLYAGMGTHLLRVVPSTAIMFLTFETVVRWLERRQQQE